MNRLPTPVVTRRATEQAKAAWPIGLAGGSFALTALFMLGAPQPAAASITLDADDALSSSLFVYTRRLTMRVGIARFGNISEVTFDVNGANVAPSPTAVTGVPSAGASPASAGADSVRISVSNRWTNFAGQRVLVTADSAAGLACSSGPCGSTVIPFSKISWTSSRLATGAYAGQDFGSGSFSGGTNQPLIDFTAPAARSFNIINDWVFSYSNDTLYPAGVYKGRVTFTATMP